MTLVGREPHTLKNVSSLSIGYLVLGQACYHLGLMEDAMVLLQTWKRLAESIADCNRILALNPTCIQALDTRASLFESIGS
ncbi:putative tetratricopeptide-like helical domain-containing protein [Lupinus albus]|uniref:Putative tetratricopeptide-like helical domain-containing protein n=1 Tax=Lupinus albus TaxID=3870 RepID=A0A6A4QPG4_LUPAL|nr:putative tetratricopeptide-like helical domain-containing protein [Lupinus albus]